MDNEAYEKVNHPSHYNHGAIECIDAIEAALTPEEFRGFCKGNALKYVWREDAKDGDTDIAKARWYLGRLAAADAVDDEHQKHCETVRPGYWKRYDFGANDDAEED